jgi:hypothetical protein
MIQPARIFAAPFIRYVALPLLLICSSAVIILSQPVSKHVNKSWAKPTPHQSTFQGSEGACAANGDGSDPDQFILKNRDDIPDSYHDVTWQAIDELPFPGKGKPKSFRAKNLRKRWTAAQLKVIKPFESIPVRAVGYIAAIKPQTSKTGPGLIQT